jgi:hypothetical protein
MRAHPPPCDLQHQLNPGQQPDSKNQVGLYREHDRDRSGVACCFLSKLDTGGQSEFGVDVGEVGLHGAW